MAEIELKHYFHPSLLIITIFLSFVTSQQSDYQNQTQVFGVNSLEHHLETFTKEEVMELLMKQDDDFNRFKIGMEHFINQTIIDSSQYLKTVEELGIIVDQQNKEIGELRGILNQQKEEIEAMKHKMKSMETHLSSNTYQQETENDGIISTTAPDPSVIITEQPQDNVTPKPRKLAPDAGIQQELTKLFKNKLWKKNYVDGSGKLVKEFGMDWMNRNVTLRYGPKVLF